MKLVNMQAAKTQLSRLVEQALAGEDVVLAKAGKPQVRLAPCRSWVDPRRGGQMATSLPEIPSDFDQPDPRIQMLFES